MLDANAGPVHGEQLGEGLGRVHETGEWWDL